MKSHPAGAPTWAEGSGRIEGVTPRTAATAFRIVAVAEALSWVGLLAGMFVKCVLETTELGREGLRADPRRRSSWPTWSSRCSRPASCAGTPGRRARAGGLGAAAGHALVRALGRPHRPAAEPGGRDRLSTGRPSSARGGSLRSPACRNPSCRPPPVSSWRAPPAPSGRAERPSLVAGVVRDGGLAWSAGRGDVPGAAHRRPVPAGLDQQDRDRRRGDAAARRGPAAPRRPARPAPAGHAASATAPSGSCSPTSPAPRPRARAAGGSARPAAPWRTSPSARTTSSSGPPAASTTPTSGFGLLGELVARLRGTSWEDAVTARGAGAAGHDPHDAAPRRRRRRRAPPCTRGPTSSCPSRSTTPA